MWQLSNKGDDRHISAQPDIELCYILMMTLTHTVREKQHTIHSLHSSNY